jgi:hypothetical protein
MRTNINFKKAPGILGLLVTLLFCWNMLAGQNVAMHFDGDNDFIVLNAPVNLASGSDFTAEMWFQTTSTDNNFRRLFSVGASGYRFEVGEENGLLTCVITGGTIVTSTLNIRDNQWHCLGVVSSGSLVDIYVDGVLAPGLSGLNTGTPSVLYFEVGHWAGYLTPGQDWLGYVDEVKIWNTALAQANLTGCSPCVLTCNEPGLIAYWRFDEGIPNGNNTSLSTVDDCTPNNNNGTIYAGPSVPPPFALNGAVSNFVLSSAPVLYPEYSNLHIKLTDPTQSGLSIVGTCEGEPVHFAIVDASGNPVSASGFATVQWQYSDDCLFTPPITIPPVSTPSALFNGFSFVTPPNDPVLTCAGLNGAPVPNGFVDRCYRAVITVTNGINTCTYFTQPAMLQICCKLPPATLTVTPPGPLCENQVVTFQAMVAGIPAPSSTNNYHLNWCVTTPSGTILLSGSSYNDLLNISYGPVTLVPGTYCIKVTVSNCLCPPVTLQHCFLVDPQPICGTIKVVLPNPALTPDPDNDPNHWLICPYNTAELMEDLPFTNCIPVWQFMFPSVGVWSDLGTSNGMQNTNILPQLKPAISPYLWPTAPNFPVFPVDETCIMYRIKCLPLSYPNSGCPPCYSNEIRICLKQPALAPVISATPQQLCKGAGGIFSFTVSPSDPNCTYEWFSNGLLVGYGDFLNTQNAGCFEVVCNDGCFAVTSNKVCVDLCEVVASISCPTPDCPMVGQPITLCAVGVSTCNLPLTYFWSWTDINGQAQTATSVCITDTPANCGTIYTLTITDSLGCSDTVQTKIEPCTP